MVPDLVGLTVLGLEYIYIYLGHDGIFLNQTYLGRNNITMHSIVNGKRQMQLGDLLSGELLGGVYKRYVPTQAKGHYSLIYPE